MKKWVLLSGGIDSTVCLYIAMADTPKDDVVSVSAIYGQRHMREISYASALCVELGIRHELLLLGDVIPRNALTDRDADIPNKSYAEINGISPMYVPFRNGLMLSAAAALAHGSCQDDLGDECLLYFGAHAEDAHRWAYPDCTPEFIGGMANAIYIGTNRQVRLVTPLQWHTKAAIIRAGQMMDVPFEKTWSCYKGDSKHCGTCPTCRARRQGFIDACVNDPTEYANPA